MGRYGVSSWKAGSVGAERAVDLVGGDVEEAEGSLLRAGETAPVLERGLEQGEGAVDVGFDEGGGPEDGAVDVALGGEVHDGVGLVLREQAGDQRAVEDGAVDEDVGRVAGERCEVVHVAGVGERVEVDDACGRARSPRGRSWSR